MSDPVQQAGGGEHILVADTPPADTREQLAQPTEKLPAPEPVKTEECISESNGEEAKAETVKVESNSMEVAPIPDVRTQPELVSQEIKDIPQEAAKPEPKQNDELKQFNGGEVKVDPIAVAPVTESKQNDELKQSNGGDEVKVDSIAAAPATEPGDKVEQNNEAPIVSDDWQKRESELLKKIEELEKVKNEKSEDGLKLELKLREEEIDLLKARVKNLETELQAALSKPGGKNHEMIENIKQQHEELLSKARGMIFDKTKMVKNQELQIEALTTQVQSLKDINVITKDLLEIRNSEVKAMEERFQAMEARFKAEKERYDLVLKRAQTSTNINDDLRKEYETQLAIFKELREKYEQRVQALVAENNRLKETAKGPGPSA